jgi:hypothetical protein
VRRRSHVGNFNFMSLFRVVWFSRSLLTSKPAPHDVCSESGQPLPGLSLGGGRPQAVDSDKTLSSSPPPPAIHLGQLRLVGFHVSGQTFVDHRLRLQEFPLRLLRLAAYATVRQTMLRNNITN